MAMAEKLSVPQLQQAIQSGSIPAYIGIPLIEQKVKAQKQASVPPVPEQRPIAQEVMEQAAGIDSVPSNLPISGYNDGGIVAFAEGGEADDDFDYEEYLEQQDEAEYDDAIRRYMSELDSAGIEGIPVNRTKKIDQKLARGGAIRFADAGRVNDPDEMSTMDILKEQNPDLYRRMIEQEGPQLSVTPDTMDYSVNAQEGSGVPSLGPALSGYPMRDTPYKVGAPYRDDLPPERYQGPPFAATWLRGQTGLSDIASEVAGTDLTQPNDHTQSEQLANSINARMINASNKSNLRQAFDALKRKEAPSQLFDADAFKEDPAYRAFVEDGGYRGDSSMQAYLSLGNPPPPSIAAEIVQAGELDEQGQRVRPERRVPKLSDLAMRATRNALTDNADYNTKEGRDVAAQTIADRAALKSGVQTVASGAKDIRTLGLETLGTGADYIGRLANMFGANVPRVPAEYTLNRGTRPAFSNLEANQRRQIPEMQDPGGVGVTNLPSVRTMSPQLVAPDMERRDFPVQAGAPATGAKGSTGSVSTGGGGGSGGGGGGGGGSGGYDGGSTGGGATSGGSDRSGRPKSAFDAFIEDIKASREDLKKQQAQDKYMALLSAGLGMMSGTSPNAFANIGQGAQAGVASYGASQKQRAAERAALNKNLLMGQRYQSMENIANRTADINEARYRAAAAARAAGSGDANYWKEQKILDQREAVISRQIKDGEAIVGATLKRKYGDNPYALTDKQRADYAADERQLRDRYVAPAYNKLDQMNRQRFPDLYENAPSQQSSSSPNSTVLRYDSKGNLIK